MPNSDQLSALERLSKLRESGALSEEEFTAQKTTILSGAAVHKAHVPFYRRLWVVVTLTCLILTFPIALLVLLTGNVYKKREGAFLPIKNSTRYVYAGALAIWIAAIVVRVGTDPQSIAQHWADSEPAAAPSNTASSPSSSAATPAQSAASGPTVPDTCDSTDAADMVKGALENGSGSNLVSIKVLDFGHASETWFNKRDNIRSCGADAVLNTGQTTLAYQLQFGPSGKEFVQVEQGDQAIMQISLAKSLKEQADQAAVAPQAPANQPPTDQQQPSDSQPSQQPSPPTDQQPQSPPANQ